MNPSKARFIARHTCWHKRPRLLNEALAEAKARLEAGDDRAAVYRCPFAAPGDEHFHMTSDTTRPLSQRDVEQVLAVLGTAAHRQEFPA